MNLFELTRQLIDIPSLTGAELEVARFLNSALQSLNYKVEVQELAPGRANLIATTIGTPRVVLSTHMDTVPPHIDSHEDEEFIYGRGACDAKGIIAAQIMTAERLRSEGIDDIGLLFTVDEEAGSMGAAVANHHSVAAHCQFLINGEPTDNKLALGSKGSLRLRIKAEGRSAHSAYPEHGESAIDKLLGVLNDLRNCSWPTDNFFGATTCNIGVIQGGVRPNVIPAHAEADLQIRLTTLSGPVKERLESLVGSRAQMEYFSVSEPTRLMSVDGFETCVVRFTTDIPHLSNWGTPLLLGPGSILDAHTLNERVSKRELEKAVDLYVKLVKVLVEKLDHERREVSEGVADR
jgi:acetylornithine deacetylase